MRTGSNPARRLLRFTFAGLFLFACSLLEGPTDTPATISPTQTDSSTALASASATTEVDAPTQAPANLIETPTQPFIPTASIPDPSAYRWEEVVRGFDQPLDLTHAGDGSGRIFIVEQGGLIHIVKDGQALTTPFLDIRDRTATNAYERGLLGLAFHPLYAQNGFFYINYTTFGGDTVIARFQVSGNQDIADSSSELRLLEVAQPFANHNGGGLAFGPDGYLYIGLGDGGSGGDPFGNGQSLNTLLGKILRIDVDRGSPYAIPPDNPFANGGGLAEIWAYGLRNPWRFSFDVFTGDVYIADVGQNIWEEVNFVLSGNPSGQNFGWNYREASHPFLGSPDAALVLVDPVTEYEQAGVHCSIIGGFVYRGQVLPGWNGVYIYGDFCSGVIWGLVQTISGDWISQQLFNLPVNISSFGIDQQGELYVVGHEGIIYRLVAVP